MLGRDDDIRARSARFTDREVLRAANDFDSEFTPEAVEAARSEATRRFGAVIRESEYSDWRWNVAQNRMSHCHGCSAAAPSNAHLFQLCKSAGVGPNLLKNAVVIGASVAVAAAVGASSAPIFLSWTRKYRVLDLELALCSLCEGRFQSASASDKLVFYTDHPLYEILADEGFTKVFMPSSKLGK